MLEIVICDCCNVKHARKNGTTTALCGWIIATMAHTVQGQPYSDAFVTCTECRQSSHALPTDSN